MARTLLALCGLSSAVVLGCRGDWVLAVMVAAIALAPAVRWVRGEMASTAAMLREHPQMMAGRHRKHRKRRSLRDAVMAALRTAARIPLP